jgi:parallel beta helix pectate lyase-like protein
MKLHMPQRLLRGGRPRLPVVPRSLAAQTAGTIVAAAAVFAAPAAAQASAAPPAPTAVPCSSSALVTAIRNANSAGAATLQLTRGCDYVLGSAAAAGDGLPPVTGKITIIGGPGTQISRSEDTPAAFRILDVAPGGALTLVSLTVANGELVGRDEQGAGIRDLGTLVLRNVRLTENSTIRGEGNGMSVGKGAHAMISGSELDNNSGGTGGAIFSVGDLVVDRSVLARNTATAGGGIFADLASTTRISRTVVTHNSAGQGGGIVAFGAMVLTGDQVTFNQATVKGGGILSPVPGTVTLRFTLVAFNSPDNCNPHGTIAGCRN